jgi:spermidine synthase
LRRRAVPAAVVCLGVSAFLTQVTLMRELLGALAGNELVLGVLLGNWMLLAGLGAALGRGAGRLRRPLAVLAAAQALLAVLPLVDVFLLRTLRNVVFVRGAEIDLTDSVVSSFVLLAPYCLLLGYLLTLASHLLSGEEKGDNPHLCEAPEGPFRQMGTVPFFRAERQDAAGIGRVYFLDNLGAVLGGVLFSFLLVERLSHFGILYVPAVLNLAAAGVLAAAAGQRRTAAALAALAAAGIAAAAIWDLDALSTAVRYPGQRIVDRGHSPYGNLVVTWAAGQYQFFENGVELFSTDNVERVEETVHYAMAQRPRARRVLLVSGGVSGTAREILKYPVAAVDDVELDPRVIEVARRLLPERLDDPRIYVFPSDGRLHVKQSTAAYDVVILDVPGPSTSQINRFYTREFFDEVHKALRPGGVLALSLAHEYEGYLSPEMARVLATLHRTLRATFADVRLIPGGKIFLLASDGELTGDVAGRLEAAGVRTRWVTRAYLAAMLTPQRVAGLERALSADGPINHDFSPVLYYYQLRYWMSQFRFRFGLLEGVLLALLAVYLVRLRPVATAVFASGFAASALEVVLLVGFQILYGSLYRQMGLIVAMFMLGLGLGSLGMTRILPRHGRASLAWLLTGLAVYAACLPPALLGLGRLGSGMTLAASQVAIPLLTLLLAVLVGMVFPLAAKLDFQNVAATASRLYTADYIGAFLGALLVSTLLIPLLGVTTVCLLTAGLAIWSAGLLTVTSRVAGV